MVLDKSAQNQDSFTSKIAASLGCDDDWDIWVTPCRHLPLNEEEEHGAKQHCEEGDTSVWQDEDMEERYNFRNNSKRLHTQKNYL